jgi:hypothetical protein
MDMRQPGEVEVVLGEMTVHRVSSGSLKRACDEIDAGSVNQDPSKIRPIQGLAAAGHGEIAAAVRLDADHASERYVFGGIR